jgi:hypothetical protein
MRLRDNIEGTWERARTMGPVSISIMREEGGVRERARERASDREHARESARERESDIEI